MRKLMAGLCAGLLAVATLPFLAAPAVAQEMEETPEPGPEHERLYAFLGEWTGEETFADSTWTPGGDRGHGTYCFSRTLNGMFVELGYSTELAKGGWFEGRGFIGYHPVRQAYQYVWIDPVGVAEVAYGDWKGDALEFELASEFDGKPYQLHIVYELQGTDEIAFRMESSHGDSPMSNLMTASYRRVGAPSAEDGAGGAAGPEDSLPACCKRSRDAVAAGGEMEECCKKAEEARRTGGEVPPCCKE
ncbi:MAG: DUF1579 family protein [Planctomycetes bacterium]|nr:DUF1579 family protein [Planctomycetota bacterium]